MVSALERLAITADPHVCHVVAVLREHGPTPVRSLCGSALVRLLVRERIVEREIDRFGVLTGIRYIESAANLRRFGVPGPCPCDACKAPVEPGWVLPAFAGKSLEKWPSNELVKKGRSPREKG